MSDVRKRLLGRWQNARDPLYLAGLFQLVVFVMIMAGLPFAATGFLGATMGCLIVSLRLQRAAGGESRAQAA